MSATGWLTDPLLARCGVAHGFGTRDCPPPAGLVRPKQVHGRRVVRVATPDDDPGEADALLTTVPGLGLAIATADCVPVLLARSDGGAVAAVHAGWRGLAAGVLPAALDALAGVGAPAADLGAAIGPYIGPCCYEVDAPVTEALAGRFGPALEAALRPARPGHHQLDLGALAHAALVAAGVREDAIGRAAGHCTRCDPVRFHSFRRDGEGAGRLLHWVSIPRG